MRPQRARLSASIREPAGAPPQTPRFWRHDSRQTDTDGIAGNRRKFAVFEIGPSCGDLQFAVDVRFDGRLGTYRSSRIPQCSSCLLLRGNGRLGKGGILRIKRQRVFPIWNVVAIGIDR